MVIIAFGNLTHTCFMCLCSDVRIQCLVYAVRMDGPAAELPASGVPRLQRDSADVPVQQMVLVVQPAAEGGAGAASKLGVRGQAPVSAPEMSFL